MTKTETVEIIGLRAFGRLVGVTLASIQDAIEVGRLTAVVDTPRGRKLLKDKALAEWKQLHSDPNPNPVDVDPDREVDDGNLETGGRVTKPWGIEKTREEALLARERKRKLELERLETEGKLLRVEDVEAVWAGMVLAARAKMLALPAKIAGSLAVKLKRDRVAVQQVIQREVEEALSELAGNVTEPIIEHRSGRAGRSKR